MHLNPGLTLPLVTFRPWASPNLLIIGILLCMAWLCSLKEIMSIKCLVLGLAHSRCSVTEASCSLSKTVEVGRVFISQSAAEVPKL